MVIKECVLEGTLSTIGNLNVNYGFAGKIAFAQINWWDFYLVESLWFEHQVQIYFERARIFRRLRLSLRIRFLRHFKIKGKEQKID